MKLLRPVSLFFNLFAKRMGEFLFFVGFKGLPIIVLCIFVMGGSAPCGVRSFFSFCRKCILDMNKEAKTESISILQEVAKKTEIQDVEISSRDIESIIQGILRKEGKERRERK